MARGWFNPTWRGLGQGAITGVGRGASATARGIGTGLKAYGTAVTHIDWSKPASGLAGAGLIAAPAAGVAVGVYGMDRPNLGHTSNYGDFLAQNTAMGHISPEQMSSYDLNRAMTSSRNMGLTKMQGFDVDALVMTKLGFLPMAPMKSMLGNAATESSRFISQGATSVGRGVVNSGKWLHAATFGAEGKLTPLNVGMTAVGIGGASYGDAIAARKNMQNNIVNYTNLRNTTPILE